MKCDGCCLWPHTLDCREQHQHYGSFVALPLHPTGWRALILQAYLQVTFCCLLQQLRALHHLLNCLTPARCGSKHMRM